LKKVVALIKKDLVLDWREQNSFAAIVLYLVSTLFISYLSLAGFIEIRVWNGLFWIILLFTSLNAVSKSFIQEERRISYYYFLCKPNHIISSKLIYSFGYLMVLSAIFLFMYLLLMGNEVSNWPLFTLNLFLSIVGLSSAFTMISAISFRSTNRFILMAILGFPIIIPVLLISLKNSIRILEGFVLIQIQGNLISLFCLDVIIIALAFTLFPLVWKS
jgi:heme exporter protein B